MAFKPVGLKTHIWNNNLRSIVILGLFPVIILVCFWLSTFISLYFMSPNGMEKSNFALSGTYDVVINYWYWVVLACGGWFFVAWGFHTRMVGTMAASHPVTRKEEPELYNLLENLSIEAGITTPRLEIIETHGRNAFASGINPKTYTVTVTRGLMNSLTKDELEAVLAHELVHILNRDVRLLIMTIIFTGMFAFAAQYCWRMIYYGTLFGGRGRRDGRLTLIIIVVTVILFIGYLVTLLLRFALSRKREYMADAGAVQLTKKPEAMINALRRISGRDILPESTADIGFMCIENSKPFLGMFATHPPIEKRIQMLALTSRIEVNDLGSLPPAPKTERLEQSSSPSNPWLTRQRRR